MAQALDYSLRCNSLTCRTPLTERAVVTTCSHIFCLSCADNLGLSKPSPENRQCPACQSSLLNPDDAVSTVLNPTEDYKTSVLSGLDPNTVMECAGRALAFWTYQTTQEIFYQEYLGKGLTEKYAALSNQMDKVVHDANSEITNLQNRMQDMQISQEQLLKKNQELVELYRDKSKKHAQVTNLYNILKSRAMRSQIATAATDSISQTLNSLGSRRGNDIPTNQQQQQQQQHHNLPGRVSRNSGHLDQNGRPFSAFDTPRDARLTSSMGNFNSGASVVGNSGVDRLSRHQRSGTGSSNGGSNRGKRRMTMDSIAMPPPPLPGRMSLNLNSSATSATPAHRTRLGTACSAANFSQAANFVNHQNHRPSTHLFKHSADGNHTILNHNPAFSSSTGTGSSHRSMTSQGFTPASSALFTPGTSHSSSSRRLGTEEISGRFGGAGLSGGMKIGGVGGNGFAF